jgi:DNA modification methylase
MEYKNKIIQGHVLTVLKQLPDNIYDTIVTSPPYFCYSDDTEVLTDNGWKNIKDVNINENVLTLNPVTKVITFESVNNKYVYPFSGKLIQFKSDNIDIRVTPNHRMYAVSTQNRGSNKFKLKFKMQYFKEASNIKTSDYLLLNGFKWEGIESEYFILPSFKKSWIIKGIKHNLVWDEVKILMDDWLRFFGFWLAEGYTRGSKGGNERGGQVGITQITHIDYVYEILSKLPFHFRRDGKTFSISNRQLWAYLKQFGNSYQKFIPSELKKLSYRQLKLLFDSYMKGDGCFNHKTAYSVSKKLLDDLQEISIKLGNTSSIRNNLIQFKTEKKCKLHDFRSFVEYNGLVYCLEVPNHTIYVRSNGRPIFCGNSQRYYPGSESIWDETNPGCEHDWVQYTKGSNCWGTPSRGFSTGDDVYNKGWIQEHSQAYCSKCQAWKGQLGCEETPSGYIRHLMQIFNEVKRVLKPTGTFFLNIGDKYCGSMSGYGIKEVHSLGIQTFKKDRTPSHFFEPPSKTCIGKEPYLKMKQLMLIPHRLAIAMEDEGGWYCRNDAIWYKRGRFMPHPVKDRLVSAHEYIFIFTKEPSYYFNLDKVRVKSVWADKDKRAKFSRVPHLTGKATTGQYASNAVGYNPKGKNPGDVLEITTSQSKYAHYAAYSEELVEICLKMGAPDETCSACGKPKKPVYKIVTKSWEDLTTDEQEYINKRYASHKDEIVQKMLRQKVLQGWLPQCKHSEGTHPGLVLDPFMGSGTTAVVCRKMHLDYTGIEISSEYNTIINNRLNEMLDTYTNREVSL